MASIGKDKGGRKRILFVAEDGGRKTVRLGKCSRRQAEAVKVKLEALVAGRLTGNMDAETARWMAELPADAYAKLVAVGNADRQYFVSRGEAGKVLEACPDSQRRLLFALCRYGGLRCPSEVLLFAVLPDFTLCEFW